MKGKEHFLFICYPKCTTCAKARQWLTAHGISFEERNIKEQNPTEEELYGWAEQSGRPLRKFFNTSGMAYRSLGLAARLSGLETEYILKLLASDGMLVKRPILVGGGHVLVGFDADEWEKELIN